MWDDERLQYVRDNSENPGLLEEILQRHNITAEHVEALGQFLDLTGQTPERLKETLRTAVARLDGDRRLFEVKMTHNGRTVTISYDPSDPEAVQTAETWRKFLFAPKPTNAKRAYGGYSIKVSNEPCYHLSGVVMSDNPDSVSFYDRDGDEILCVNRAYLVSVLRVDKGEALMGYMPHEATVNAGNGKWEGE